MLTLKKDQPGWRTFVPRLTYREYLNSPNWATVRTAALQRAGHKCAACECTRGLQVHHVHYRTLGHEQPGDLLVLCDDCHLAISARAKSRKVARLVNTIIIRVVKFMRMVSW